MLQDLRDYGVVYQRKMTSRRFYPTRLATTLTSDASAIRSVSKTMDMVISSAKGGAGHKGGNERPNTSDSAASNGLLSSSFATESSGFIIIETNFRLYAYTSSPLQISVLNLFVSLKTRFANMISGYITRESVRDALQKASKLIR